MLALAHQLPLDQGQRRAASIVGTAGRIADVSIVVLLAEPPDFEAAVDIFARCGKGPASRPTNSQLTRSGPRLRRSDLDVRSGRWVRRHRFCRGDAVTRGPWRGPLVPGLCYLDLIFVVPERWGEGVGALLLDTVIADARGRGFARIHLLTHDDNERAQRLYAIRGFERTGWSRMSSDPANGQGQRMGPTALKLALDLQVTRRSTLRRMKVSELAGRAGVTPAAVRFYESEGFLPQPHAPTTAIANTRLQTCAGCEC